MTYEEKQQEHLRNLVQLTCTFLTGADIDDAIKDAIATYKKLQEFVARGEHASS